MSQDRTTTPNGIRYILERDGIIQPEALAIIEELENELADLRSSVGTACNALTDAIKCLGNDPETNLDFVQRLRACLFPENEQGPTS